MIVWLDDDLDRREVSQNVVSDSLSNPDILFFVLSSTHGEGFTVG